MRNLIGTDLLTRLVDDELQRLISAGSNFTAYNVTCSLRRTHPSIEVQHAYVRLLVHTLMRSAVAAGVYQSSVCNLGSEQAILYEPAPHVGPLDLPMLKLN